jgi:hypothetical protein
LGGATGEPDGHQVVAVSEIFSSRGAIQGCNVMAVLASASRICARMMGAMLAVVFLTAAPLAASKPALAQARAATSISVEFRTALEPYGRFDRHSRWGDVWIPANRSRDWRPYTVGHWAYTNDWGWYWISDEAEADWGWVVYHYGRWVFDRDLGWCWVPGDAWSPAWVQWRRGDARGGPAQYVGWAPLPPDDVVVEYRDEPDVWIFVRGRDFIAPRIVSVILPVRQYNVFIQQTVIVNRTVVIHDHGPMFAVNPGISPAVVAAISRRPVRAFEVHPLVIAGTARIPGAREVRAQDLSDKNLRAQMRVRQTQDVIRPADRVQPPQPLAAGENGRLGDNPPRAARREAPAPTTGQTPQQRQQQQGRDAQEPRQPQTQGRGADEQRLPPAREGRGAQPPLQQPQIEGRGADEQRDPASRRGRDARQPQQPPQIQGRGAEEPREPAARRGRDARQPQAQPQTQGRGAEQVREPQTPSLKRDGDQQRQQREGRGAEPRQPQTQGRGAEPPRQPPTPSLKRDGDQQRQQREGRGAPPQAQPRATEGRGNAPQQRAPQASEGRGGGDGRGGGGDGRGGGGNGRGGPGGR